MKKLSLLLLILLISFTTETFSQDVIEVKNIELSDDYKTYIEEYENMTQSDEIMKKSLDALNDIEDSYGRFNIYLWVLSYNYAAQGKYQECVDILHKGMDEGLYFPLRKEPYTFPGYLNELKKRNDFDELFKRNRKMQEEAQKNSKPTFYIKKPNNFDPQKKYPLLLCFAGGFGSYYSLAENWHSDKTDHEYIVAFLQGKVCEGSYLKSYGRENLNDISLMYQKITETYPIDTSRVILAAQSAGTYFTLKIASDDILPVNGIILSFPHIPRDLDFVNYKKIAEQNISISVTGGEYDHRRIVRTKELSVNFDKNKIRNRLIIFPEIGHDFPEDFRHQLDLSLDFIETPLSER